MAKLSYKISARTTILLGRQNVSRADGALIELIKNTYDADASICALSFDIDNDKLYVIDDGMGMTKDVIENYWMTIGTDNKLHEFKSSKNRIKSGEKGIGRFALDRLGKNCVMFTKSAAENQVIRWSMDWSSFEKPGATLGEIEAEIEYVDHPLLEALPDSIVSSLNIAIKKSELKDAFSNNTGTILCISRLSDKWPDGDIDNLVDSLGFLLPPEEQSDYHIFSQKKTKLPFKAVENATADDYDYKIESSFHGESVSIDLYRNEFDLHSMPESLFLEKRFQEFPYTKADFEKEYFHFEYPISKLVNTDNEETIEKIRKLGDFSFTYSFKKITLNDDSIKKYFYKSISPRRKEWMENYGGVKIYRDNFIVRPYGYKNADSYDWLGLDARKTKSPAGIGHPSESWKVRNAQSQGTLLISRVSNKKIMDKSSREGLIENEYFQLLRVILINIISIFERDRAYIVLTIRQHLDKEQERDKTKDAGTKISKRILRRREHPQQKRDTHKQEDVRTLAKTVKYYEEEHEELIDEIKLLRALATNGLITTSIVHDLKGMTASLVHRVDWLKESILQKESSNIEIQLKSIKKWDKYLRSWIQVITEQIKRDKRKRLKKDLYVIIPSIINVVKPILENKEIKLKVLTDKKEFKRRIFESDFESILYNLIINSIESFDQHFNDEKVITIELSSQENQLTLRYKDNGDGISKNYTDPYVIFNFGETTKLDKNGNAIGTGLGMYIPAEDTEG